MTERIARRDSWKTKPMSEAQQQLPFSQTFTRDEMERIQRGFIPSEMEDKWFVFFEDDWLYCHRSWTGFCIFRLHIVADGALFVCHEAWASRNPDEYKVTDTKEDQNILGLIFLYLFQVVLAKPTPQ